MENTKWEVKITSDSNGFVNIMSEDLNIATFYGGFERTIPNARLAVCAPELLEALNESITLLYGTTEFEVLENYRKKINDFEQLITKATTI